MAGLGGVGVPSLSEIQAWDVAHLEGAATDWTATAERWESSFTSIHRLTVSPGGTVWEGAAAEAAQERAFADLVQVRGLADVLHESSAIARRGAEILDAAKRSVLDAVEEASDAGYVVGEDLSVTPPRPGVTAAAQAQVYAVEIQQRAAQLVAHDAALAAKITVASAPLNGVTFPWLGRSAPVSSWTILGIPTPISPHTGHSSRSSRVRPSSIQKPERSRAAAVPSAGKATAAVRTYW